MRYERSGPRPTLRTRILENEARLAIAGRSDRLSGGQQGEVSFAERYRGTEFEPAPVLPAPRPAMSRGRSLLLVVGSTVVATLALILTTPPA